jgi:periplasmic divalent cation tolerance protein
MTVVFVYVTTKDADEARMLARMLVEERLAACANILPDMQSVYHWDGKLQETSEAVLILKTRSTLFPAVEARVKELHSYKTPCIVGLPIGMGHGAFLSWVLAETKP